MKKLLQSIIKFDTCVEWMNNAVKVDNEIVSFAYLICLHWETLKQAGHAKSCFIYVLGGQDAIFNTK